MAVAAWIFGILGGLSAVMGIVTAAEVIPWLDELPAGFTAIFWLTLGAILLLACIAAAVAHRSSE